MNVFFHFYVFIFFKYFQTSEFHQFSVRLYFSASIGRKFFGQDNTDIDQAERILNEVRAAKKEMTLMFYGWSTNPPLTYPPQK